MELLKSLHLRLGAFPNLISIKQYSQDSSFVDPNFGWCSDVVTIPYTAELVEGTRSIWNQSRPFIINCPVSTDYYTQIGKVVNLMLNGATFNLEVQGVLRTIRPLGSTLTDSNALYWHRRSAVSSLVLSSKAILSA